MILYKHVLLVREIDVTPRVAVQARVHWDCVENLLQALDALRENESFLSFPLCLSRACLGKMVHIMDLKVVFLPGRTQSPSSCSSDTPALGAGRRTSSNDRATTHSPSRPG
jgi:hypothetical protein